MRKAELIYKKWTAPKEADSTAYVSIALFSAIGTGTGTCRLI